MDSARNQFLTCSRFAEDQDGRIGFGNRAHLLEDLNTALVWLFSPVRNLQGAGHRSILAFANDLCGEDSGKRIFPIIGVGSSLGAWVGARMAAHLFKQMDAYALMLVAMAGLLLSIVSYAWPTPDESGAMIYRRSR